MATKRARDASISSSSEDEEQTQEARKYSHVDYSTNNTIPAIRCFLPPHSPYAFSSYEDFDIHYHKVHVNRCSECSKNFPTDQFLTLHISEVHDSLAEAKRARGDKVFRCFLESCEKVFLTPQKRRLHLIDKHHFPKNYNFFITKDGIDKRHSMLVPRYAQRRVSQGSAAASSSSFAEDVDITTVDSAVKEREAEESHSPEATSSTTSQSNDAVLTPPSSGSNDADMDSLTKTMSSLNFIPRSVRFGRGGGRGFSRR